MTGMTGNTIYTIKFYGVNLTQPREGSTKKVVGELNNKRLRGWYEKCTQMGLAQTRRLKWSLAQN